VSDSNEPIAGETRQQQRERERQEVRARVRKWKGERRRKRLKRAGLIAGPLVVLLVLLTQLGGDSSQTSDDGSGASATTAPSSATTVVVVSTLRARQARYISLDGAEFEEGVTLIRLWETALQISNNAFNGLNNALGLPDELGNEDGRRVGLWLLPGGGSVRVAEGDSMLIFCGAENVIAANVGDGVIVCRSTLEEANQAAADGIGVFQFEPDAATGGAGDWTACGSEVATERARVSFRVNATSADDAGSSASEASPTDIVNVLKLSVCES